MINTKGRTIRKVMGGGGGGAKAKITIKQGKQKIKFEHEKSLKKIIRAETFQ